MARKTKEQELTAFLLPCMVYHIKTDEGLSEAVLVDITKPKPQFLKGTTIVSIIPRIKL